MRVLPLYTGFPARSHRGYLGLSSAYLVLGAKTLLYDTLGFGERESLYPRLLALEVHPEAVELVVVSHLHFDHAANLDLFPWAEVVIHPAEMAHAEEVRQDPLRDPACLYTLLPLLRGRRLLLAQEGELLPGLRLLHLPGHTPGLLGLLVEGVGVLASDAVKSRYDLEGPPAPPCLDPASAQESRNRLTAFQRLFPGHDVPLKRTETGFIPEEEGVLRLLWGSQETCLRLKAGGLV